MLILGLDCYNFNFLNYSNNKFVSSSISRVSSLPIKQASDFNRERRKKVKGKAELEREIRREKEKGRKESSLQHLFLSKTNMVLSKMSKKGKKKILAANCFKYVTTYIGKSFKEVLGFICLNYVLSQDELWKYLKNFSFLFPTNSSGLVLGILPIQQRN